MAKTKGERATTAIRIYPSTHRKLKILAAKTRNSLAKVVDILSQIK